LKTFTQTHEMQVESCYVFCKDSETDVIELFGSWQCVNVSTV